MLCRNCESFFGRGTVKALQQEQLFPISVFPGRILRTDGHGDEHQGDELCDFCFFLTSTLLTYSPERTVWKDKDFVIKSTVHRLMGGLKTQSQKYSFMAYAPRSGMNFELIKVTGELVRRDLGRAMLTRDRRKDLAELESTGSRERVKTGSTGSDTSIEIVTRWIETCTKDHSLCTSIRERPQPDGSWLPTRLLEVIPNNPEDGDLTVILRENLDLVSLPDSRYAALTYCRGPSLSCALTMQNVTEWKNGVSVGSLPQTFTDAAWMTVRLGLRYLWIDALCILQEKEQDWLYEGKTISNLYTYSYINFCATASEDSNGGLFHVREPSILNGCEVDIAWEEVEKGSYLCIPNNARGMKMRDSPLNRRAWAVQETLLSSRTIFFASDQLYWECCEARCMEAHPDPKSWGNRLRQELNHKHDFAELRKGKDLSQEEFADMWRFIVQDYTLGELTRPSDKLIAISGIVQAIQAARPDEEYLAGLWRSDLLRSLLWHKYPAAESLSRFETYVAPSWSWASVNGRVFNSRPHPMLHAEEKIVVDILEASTEPIAGPVGPVRGGSIKLRGRLCPVGLGVAVDKHPSGGSLALRIDGYQLSEWYVIVELDDERNGDMDWSSCKDLFLLQFTHDPSAEQAPETRRPNVGLKAVSKGLVLRATRERKGEFRRVGVWSTRCWTDYWQIKDYLGRQREGWNVGKAWRLWRGFGDHGVVERKLREGMVEEEGFWEERGKEEFTIRVV